MPKYNDNILNYYNDDSHIGSLDINDKNVGTGLVGSPSCGDVMKLQIQVDEKDGIKIIKDAKILVFGCGSAKASSSYVAQQLVGKTIEEALKIKNSDIADYLGLPKIKLHCSVLAESAIKRAIEDYKNKQNEENNNKKINNSDEKENKNNDFSLSITDEAILFVKSNLEKVEKEKNKEHIKGIRLNLEEGHCGLMYKVRYVEQNEDTTNDIDYIVKAKDDKNDLYELHIFVKKTESEILNETKIEYKEENLKRGLVFKNPRETGRCNCGLNFFTDKKNKENK